MSNGNSLGVAAAEEYFGKDKSVPPPVPKVYDPYFVSIKGPNISVEIKGLISAEAFISFLRKEIHPDVPN